MSTSPFELFRRNLKPLMVVLTGLAMFAFVVLPALDTYMRGTAGSGGGEVVATFDRSQLTRNRVDYFTRNHQSTIRFLVELAEETIRRGGSPQTAGFSYDPSTQRVMSVGINEVPSFQGTIRTLMLAAQAQKDGFELDDTTLQVWLQEYTNGMISDRDITSMLMRSTQNQMGRPHLYEQLRNHLLARVYEERGLSGMFLGQSPASGPLMTPEEQWANFLKLNRNAVANAYGVLVSEYLPQTNASPSETEIKTIYEEGKNRDPNNQSPDPAFHRRYTAKIEYVSGDFQSFVDAEVAKLSEADIRAEYEKRLKGGEFQLPPEETTPDETPEPAESSPAAPETKPTDAEGDTGAEPAAPADPETAADPEAAAPAADDAPAAETPGPAESGDATGPTGDSDSSESESSSPESAPAPSDQSRRQLEPAVRLVSAQQDEQPPSAAEGEAAGQSEEPSGAAAANSEESPAAGEDASSPSGDAQGPADQENPASAENAATEKPADPPVTSDESAPDETASEQPASEQPAEQPSGDAEQATADSSPAPKVESFEDVRQQIAEEMVADQARQKMDKLMSDIANQMRRYFSENAIYQSNLSIGQADASTPPKRPDLARLAEENGLQHEVIGPYDQVSIRDEPIARSMELGSQFLGQSASFVQMMFGTASEQTDEPSQPLFAPVRTADGPAGRQYVAWKIEDTPAYTPSLDDVRDEVVLAIRMKEARKLARDAAETIAKEASQQGKSLKEVVPQDKLDNFKEDLGPFTWMNSFGFAGATIGNVPELDSVGDEFMKAVFENEPGELKVGENQPGSVVYIVEPKAFEPGLEELRRQFRQPTNRVMAMLLGNGAGPIINDFFDQMDEKAKFRDLTVDAQP